MVQFDNQYRQIKIKIVYYGPALGGKTTCLQHIHRVTDPQRRTKLYSLNTASDRTLFFDLLSLNLGRIRGYRLAMQLYTVPGQVQYNATRRAVLSGADGVVFVADSQVDQREANIQSLENLWENLAANGIERDSLPLVLLYNKRDLSPLLTIDEMASDLADGGVPGYPSVAVSGEGVMEAFAAISERTLAAVADKLGVGTNPQAVERLQQQVRIALEPYVDDDEAPTDGGGRDDAQVAVTTPAGTASQPLSQEVLVGEAVRANMAMTDLNARLDTLRAQLERKVQALAGITEFGTRVADERDPPAVLRTLLKTAIPMLRVQGAAVMVVPGSGQMREAVVHGFERDPLLATPDEAGEPLAVALLEDRRPQLIARDLEGESPSFRIAAVEAAGFRSAVAAPMVAHGRLVGVLTAYGGPGRAPLDDDDLQLATILAATAAVAYDGAGSWRQLEGLNRSLSDQVAARTQELRGTLDEVQRLNRDLAEKHSLLEDAYRDLTELDRIKNELITRISHELKTPVTSLVTAAKILDRYRDAPAEKGARFVAIIRDEAEKLAEIIQSVFQASVLASPVGGPSIQRVPVEDLLRRAIAPLRDLASEREVTLHVLIPSGLEAVACDPETTEAALRAVIKNAVEFNHKGGEVKVEVRRATRDDRTWLVVKVRDTGVGIPDEELPHVFETFWQGGNVLTGKPRGVGLGLAIAKRVVENHGGRISLTSRVADGTEVTIAIPQDH